MNSTRVAVLASVLAVSGLSGCAADSPILDNMLIVPGYYDTLNCSELGTQVVGATMRIKELTDLMEKSAGGTAGPVVNAMAYNTEYAKARATQKYAEEAARRKGCDSTKKAEPPKPALATPSPAMPDLGMPSRSPGR